jgi:hypothetical protein
LPASPEADSASNRGSGPVLYPPRNTSRDNFHGHAEGSPDLAASRKHDQLPALTT